MSINIKELEAACERFEKDMMEYVDKVRSEQEVHMEKMFKECGYSWREVIHMLRSGEMVGHSRDNTYGFTRPNVTTTYTFYTRGEVICVFYVNDKMVECANSKDGYGISWNVFRTYNYIVHKTREEIENGR